MIRWYRLWHLFLAWSALTGEQGRGDCFQIVAHKSRREFDRSRWVTHKAALGEFSLDHKSGVPRRIGS